MRKDEQIKEILEGIKKDAGIDYRYDHFEEYDAVPPPYIIYRRVAGNNFSADGTVYHRGDNVDIEVYASTDDEMAELMDEIESRLDAAELYYKLTADTVYISSEDFYETLYEL